MMMMMMVRQIGWMIRKRKTKLTGLLFAQEVRGDMP